MKDVILELTIEHYTCTFISMINKLHGKPKGQCRMDNLETHATLGTKTQNEDKKKHNTEN